MNQPTENKQTAEDRYANSLAEYHLGLRWMRVAVPAVLTPKEAAKVRQKTYAWLRENFPGRFPAGHRFH